MRVKWTKYSPDLSQESDVFVSMGFHQKAYGSFHGRAFMREADDSDASLVITNVGLDDNGKYKCEVIDGMDDNIAEVTVELEDTRGKYTFLPITLHVKHYKSSLVILLFDMNHVF